MSASTPHRSPHRHSSPSSATTCPPSHQVISPLLVPRTAAPQQTWLSTPQNNNDRTPPARDRSNTTSAPPVDYMHATTSGVLGMFDHSLEQRYRDYWHVSYGQNARRGLIASMLLAFVFGVLGDAGKTLFLAGAEGGVDRFLRLVWIRVGGLLLISCGLVLFRRMQPGQWGYSVWPRWGTPVHLASLLFVVTYWVQSSIVAVREAHPSDMSLGLWYFLLLILIPSQCATLLHNNYTLVAFYCAALLVSSIVLTVVYTDYNVTRLVVYSVAVAFTHVIYVLHAHRENVRNRLEFLAFCHLQQEEEVNQRLLLKMLPLSIIHKLRGGAEYVYEKYERVSVLFSHIDDFDLHTAAMQPIQLVRTLNKLFSLFDALTDEHRVYKVETIGDVFLVSSGCPAEYARDDHASALCVLAVDMMAVVKAFKVRHDETRRTSIRLMSAVPQLFSQPSVSATTCEDDRATSSAQLNYSSSSSNSATNPNSTTRLSHSSLDLRIGINTGPVIAGVVGVKYPRYRLMGDTINTASRMSTTCERGEIQLSSATYGDLNAADFVCQQRSKVEVKGKGLMQTYILKEHRLSHRTSATKVVQALGASSNYTQAQSPTNHHHQAPSIAMAGGVAAVLMNGKGKQSPSLSHTRALQSNGAATTRPLTEKQRKAQLTIDAVAHSSSHDTLSDSPLMRPTVQKVSSFFAHPIVANPDASNDDGRGVRVMSVYNGQDELADMIRAKSAQVVHLVPAAHRMSVSTAASSEVDAERMLQSAPVSAAHSREGSQTGCNERQLTAHIYPASAPLTPHDSMEQQVMQAFLQPPKPERALTDSMQGTASTATTITTNTTNTRSSLSLPVPSNSSAASAYSSSMHSSSNEISSISTSSTTPEPPATTVPASSNTPHQGIKALIQSSSSALSAPTFAAPPLASLAGAAALHPKLSISSAPDSQVSQSLGPNDHPLASPPDSSRVGDLPATGAEPSAAAAAVDRRHRLLLHGSSESLSSASSVDSARSSMMVALVGTDSALQPTAKRPHGSVSQFPGTPSSIARSRTGTLSSPDSSPREHPMQHSARLPALIIPQPALPQAHRGSQDSDHLATTPSSASSVNSPSSATPDLAYHGLGTGGGQAAQAELNQSVHPSHLTNSGIDFSPNTHYRFLLPSPSQLPRDAREARAPVSPRAAAATSRQSSRARQSQNNNDPLIQPPATATTSSAASSLLATVLRARGDSSAPIIPPAAADSADGTELAGALNSALPTGRRRQRDVVITAHSQRVRTTKMFTYGDSDALLHPPRPWLAKLSLTFITDPRLEAEFRKERLVEEDKMTRLWTIVPLVSLFGLTLYEEFMFSTGSLGAGAAVWLLRLLTAVTQLSVLWVIREEERRLRWKQTVHFVAATVWCSAFIINNFLQDAFLTRCTALSILLFSYSIITMFLLAAPVVGRPRLSSSLSSVGWMIGHCTHYGPRMSVPALLLYTLSASCLYLGSSYSTEFRDRSSFPPLSSTRQREANDSELPLPTSCRLLSSAHSLSLTRPSLHTSG